MPPGYCKSSSRFKPSSPYARWRDNKEKYCAGVTGPVLEVPLSTQKRQVCRSSVFTKLRLMDEREEEERDKLETLSLSSAEVNEVAQSVFGSNASLDPAASIPIPNPSPPSTPDDNELVLPSSLAAEALFRTIESPSSLPCSSFSQISTIAMSERVCCTSGMERSKARLSLISYMYVSPPSSKYGKTSFLGIATTSMPQGSNCDSSKPSLATCNSPLRTFPTAK